MLLSKKDVYNRIINLVYDVNPAEIASHIQNDSLREWCHSWASKMINEATLILLLPDNVEKEKEE